MRKILLLLAISLSAFASAQTTPVAKTVIGYCNFDSILNLMPVYRSAADSVKKCDDIFNMMQGELFRKSHEFDSLNLQWSPPIRAIKQKEIDDLKTNIENFKLQVKKIYGEKMALCELKLTDVVQKIATEKNYAAVLDSEISDAFAMWSAPGTSFVNITKDVCAQLGIPK
jgi:Skp family chaperone for outer membrane proteins